MTAGSLLYLVKSYSKWPKLSSHSRGN